MWDLSAEGSECWLCEECAQADADCKESSMLKLTVMCAGRNQACPDRKGLQQITLKETDFHGCKTNAFSANRAR